MKTFIRLITVAKRLGECCLIWLKCVRELLRLVKALIDFPIVESYVIATILLFGVGPTTMQSPASQLSPLTAMTALNKSVGNDRCPLFSTPSESLALCGRPRLRGHTRAAVLHLKTASVAEDRGWPPMHFPIASQTKLRSSTFNFDCT